MPKAARRVTAVKQPKPQSKTTIPSTTSVAERSKTLPSGYQLLRSSVSLLWQHKKLFGGILFAIGCIQLVAIQGVLNTDFASVRTNAADIFGHQWLGLTTGTVSYVYLLGSSGQPSSTEAGLYQSSLLIIAILAIVWALRELTAGNQPRIRDTFYKGMTPFVPFTLITLVLGLQLLPAVLGAWVYSIVTTNGIAVHTYEYVGWFLIFILLVALSARFITGSLFALVIATLPNATPIASLRSAQTLVHKRRLVVFRKLLFLDVALLVCMTIVVLPAILLLPAIVPVLFYVMSLLMFALAIVYVYVTYQELVRYA